MKLTLKDKIILVIVGIAVLIFLAYKVIFVPTAAKIEKLNNSKTEVEALSADITPVVEQRDKLKLREIELIGIANGIKNKETSLTATTQELLVFLGESAANNEVQITGFNDLGMTSEDGVYTATFDFELRGSAIGINSVLDELDNLGIRTSYGSISYRQNEDYEYLKRYFDDLTELHWYVEPEENTEENIDKQVEKELEIQAEEKREPQSEIPHITPMPEITQTFPTTPNISTQPPSVPGHEYEEPHKEDKTINDRLNSLLEKTSKSNNDNRFTFLTKTKGVPITESHMLEPISVAKHNMFISHSGIREMRLAVTARIIMFSEPQYDTSILKNRGAELNEVL